ncbi:uncharacterized protein LOC129267122 isoform X2 [Lytechinus pictus]|uniref:uncharacterized protein LOC129267122 isoform X2 n=1 Tax=Lytechinus pictus TaxID=7653 RepID=UPI0030BA0BC5
MADEEQVLQIDLTEEDETEESDTVPKEEMAVPPDKGSPDPERSSSPVVVLSSELDEPPDGNSGHMEVVVLEDEEEEGPSVVEDSKKVEDSVDSSVDIEPPVDVAEKMDDDGEESDGSQSSEDMDMLLIADDSDSSDDDTDGLLGESMDREGSSVEESLEKDGCSIVEVPEKLEDNSKDGESNLEAPDESDLQYKVKITRVGGGDFEGFEITHEPVSKSYTRKDDQASDRGNTKPAEGESSKEGIEAKEEASPCSGTSIKEIEGVTEREESAQKPEIDCVSTPSFDKEQRLSDSQKMMTTDLEAGAMRQLPSPTSTRSSENKSSIRPPSSPFSSDYKPSTPGTLSSRSSTTGSYDGSGKSVGDSANSSKLRAMRNSTRERRENREERERQEKLSKGEKGRELSRSKSNVDKRRLSHPKGVSLEPEPLPPKTRGRMTRVGFDFLPGSKLEAMDYLNNWYPAKILQIDESRHQIQIHFEGWNSRYDQWIHYNSPKLRSLVRMSNRKEGFKEVPEGNHRIGEEVLARWSDCRYYPGKIVGANTSGSYRIIFYDGIEKNVLGMNVRDMPEELKKQDFFSNLQAQIERAERNAAQRKANRQKYEAKKLQPLSPASSSTGSSPPEERKRKLSTSSPAPPTPIGAKVKRSRSSTEQVEGSSEEVKGSRNLSQESRKSRRSTEEVKSPKAAETDPGRRSRYASEEGRRSRNLSEEGRRSILSEEGRRSILGEVGRRSTLGEEGRRLRNLSGESGRSRSSTEEVRSPKVAEVDLSRRSRSSSEEGRRSRLASGDGLKLRSSTEEVESPTAEEVERKRSKFGRFPGGVHPPEPTRKGGHFLMGGGGSVKKKEVKKEGTGVKLALTKHTTVSRPRFVGRPTRRPVGRPTGRPVGRPPGSSLPRKEARSASNLPGKELRSVGNVQGKELRSATASTTQATTGKSPAPVTSSAPGVTPTSTPRARPGHVIIPVVEHISMDERLEVAKNLEKLRAIATKEPLFANTHIGHLKDPTKFIAPKELIVDLDHNKFKCEVPGCTKSFRKASLLESHMKYYHAEPGAESGPPQDKDKDKPSSRPRKRNYSATQTSSSRIRRDSETSCPAAGSTSPSSPPARLIAKRSSAPDTISSPTQGTKKPEAPVMKSPRSPPPIRSPRSPPAQPSKSPKSPPAQLMKSPKSPPTQQLVKSPKSPPPPQPMKSPKSPPPQVSKVPKSPSGTPPSGSVKDTKPPQETKPPKEPKSPKEATLTKSPKETTSAKLTKEVTLAPKSAEESMKSPKEVTTTKPSKENLSTKSPKENVSTKPSKSHLSTKTEKRIKKEDVNESLSATGRVRHESKSEKSKSDKSSKEKKGSSSEGGGETVKKDSSKKAGLLATSNVSRKTEKTSSSKSGSTIIPSIIPLIRTDSSKAEAGGFTKREGMSKLDKLKHKKHKDKHKKHKDKKKKKKKKKEKEKKKKKKKRQKDGGKMGILKSQKYKDIDEYILEKKKKEFQFEMPLPVSQFKENYSRHPAPILKSQLLRSVERSDPGHGRGSGEGEIVRCICYRKTEEGFMIQCERCLCWQHSSCVGLTKSTVPDQYVCLICFNPRDQRVSAKYRYGQKWLDDGDLASFSFAPKEHMKEASHNLAATNRLIGEMHVINEVLRGLREKLHILQTDDHPAMKLWARSWLKPKVPETPKPDPLANPGLESSLSPTLDPALSEFKDSLSIDGSLDPEASLTPQETEQIARIMAMSGDLEMATLANLALPCEVGLDSSASSMIDGSLLKEDQNLGDVEMGGLTSVAQGEVVDVGMGVLESVVGGMEVKNAPGHTLGMDASAVMAPGMDASAVMAPGMDASAVMTPGVDGASSSSSSFNAGDVGEVSSANIPKTPVIQQSKSEDFEPPTVKFVMSSGTERSSAKEPAIVDISDIPSTSAGPSQEQLEAAGMMRFQPLTHNDRREETHRHSPLPQDESSLDTESSMDLDEEDAKPEKSKESLRRTSETETKEEDESMDISEVPESGPSSSKSESQLDTVPVKEPPSMTTEVNAIPEIVDAREVGLTESVAPESKSKETVAHQSTKDEATAESAVADAQVDDGSVAPTTKPEGTTEIRSTASEPSSNLVVTEEKVNDDSVAPMVEPEGTPVAESAVSEASAESVVARDQVGDDDSITATPTSAVIVEGQSTETEATPESVSADANVDDGAVAATSKPEGTVDGISTVTEVSPDVNVTNEQNQKEGTSPLNLNIASSESDKESEKKDCITRPDSELVRDVKAPEGVTLDNVSDVQPAVADTKAGEDPSYQDIPNPEVMNPEVQMKKVAKPDNEIQKKSHADIQKSKDSLSKAQDDTDAIPADSCVETGVPPNTNPCVASSNMEGVQANTGNLAAGDSAALVGSLVPSDQLHPTTDTSAPGTVDAPTKSLDPANKEMATASGVDPGGLLLPPVVGPGGDSQAFVTPDVRALGPLGMSRVAPPVPMEVEDQPSTSGYSNQSINHEAISGGSGVWKSVQNVSDVPVPVTKEESPVKEEIEIKGSLKIIKVPLSVCKKNLREHIEYLEAELEKRMDIIEEEANALEQQFAELPGLSPDIRGLATMNDTFLKTKMQTLLGDLERINNIVAM